MSVSPLHFIARVWSERHLGASVDPTGARFVPMHVLNLPIPDFVGNIDMLEMAQAPDHGVEPCDRVSGIDLKTKHG